MANYFAYRIDNHGGAVRPKLLQQARDQLRAGEITADELAAIEDEQIQEWITTQRHLTLSCLSDGGYRNGDYRSPVLWNVQGFTRAQGQMSDAGFGTWIVDGPLKLKSPIAADAASFMLEHTGFPVKVNLPSPAHIAAQCYDELKTVRAYPGAAALGDALAELMVEEIEHLFELGVKFIQFDNPDYSAYLVGRDNPLLTFDEAVQIDNAVIAGLEKEEDQKVALATGWGDNLDGDVDYARVEKLFATSYDKFTVPFHNEAAVAQDLPRYVPEGKQVSLGIVDATTPALEDIDTVVKRIEDVIDVHDYDAIGLLPQRPFQAAHYQPAALTQEEQRKKLEQVEIFATMIWGNEA
ncbi:5-methyltetrahydropteroyltriglutamate--homocysteine S-methyltransferase [Microbacterium sediminicola]|uniref:5-methyltetrahydropteroyltriglutamate--homocysteine S-methyltransferase n=1 Tax=Microbacterium sediminicola TaxID=415210 RepID=A0ABN2IGB0_9MICO